MNFIPRPTAASPHYHHQSRSYAIQKEFLEQLSTTTCLVRKRKVEEDEDDDENSHFNNGSSSAKRHGAAAVLVFVITLECDRVCTFYRIPI